MATTIAIIAIIIGLTGLFMAWIAGRQHSDLARRLGRTNERIEALRRETEGDQQKMAQERARLQSEVAKLKGGNGATVEAVSPGAGESFHIIEITPQELKARLDNGDDLVVVDMRQPFEYQVGHIPGAINMFIQYIPMRAQELPKDKDIVFQCWHGHTSLQASAYLIDKGWSPVRVVSLSGGMAGWTQTHGVGSLIRD